MHPRSPDPAIRLDGSTLWVAYRTPRADHCAVVVFRGVASHGFAPAGTLQAAEAAGAAGSGRWRLEFPGDALLVAAERAEIVVRAVQAHDPAAALAMVLAHDDRPL